LCWLENAVQSSPALVILSAVMWHFKKPNMKQISLLIILTVFIIESCKSGTSETWKNDHIDKHKRDQISVLNAKLFKGIINNDLTAVKELLSADLLAKSGTELEQLLNQVSSSFKSDSYRILDEYNIKNSNTGLINTIPSGLTGDNDYVIQFQALNKEMYVSLLLPNGIDNDLLITAIYGKYNKEWKLNILRFGQFSFFSKTAPDYYNIAKTCYEKSYLVDAVNYLSLSKQCLRPANDFFVYQKEKEINEFADKVIKEATSKFQFPLTLEDIATKPQVFRIYPQMIDEGIYPMVWYLSSINLDDTAALQKEQEKIKVEVYKLFLGLNKDRKYVFYKAYNEIPDGKKKVKSYGFCDDL
jgi:hypothetical protein